MQRATAKPRTRKALPLTMANTHLDSTTLHDHHPPLPASFPSPQPTPPSSNTTPPSPPSSSNPHATRQSHSTLSNTPHTLHPPPRPSSSSLPSDQKTPDTAATSLHPSSPPRRPNTHLSPSLRERLCGREVKAGYRVSGTESRRGRGRSGRLRRGRLRAPRGGWRGVVRRLGPRLLCRGG